MISELLLYYDCDICFKRFYFRDITDKDIIQHIKICFSARLIQTNWKCYITHIKYKKNYKNIIKCQELIIQFIWRPGSIIYLKNKNNFNNLFL